MVIRATIEGCRQRWRLRTPNSSRKMVKFSNKVQNSSRRMTNSRRRPFKSAGNRESYKH